MRVRAAMRMGLLAGRSALNLALVLGLAVALGCTPRGESKSLAEILSIAQADFSEQLTKASQGAGGLAVEAQIKALEQQLAVLVADGSDAAAVGAASGEIATALAQLTSRAGYASRPAFTELAKQLRELQKDAGVGDAAANQTKLLATRVYSSVASELATTRFNVLPLSPAGS